MGRLTHEQQERLIRIFNDLGYFPDKRIQSMSWDEYGHYVALHHKVVRQWQEQETSSQVSLLMTS